MDHLCSLFNKAHLRLYPMGPPLQYHDCSPLCFMARDRIFYCQSAPAVAPWSIGRSL